MENDTNDKPSGVDVDALIREGKADGSLSIGNLPAAIIPKAHSAEEFLGEAYLKEAKVSGQVLLKDNSLPESAGWPTYLNEKGELVPVDPGPDENIS